MPADLLVAAPAKGDGETWEDYAHRLEARIKRQRNQLHAVQDLRDGPQRKARQRIAALERLLGKRELVNDQLLEALKRGAGYRSEGASPELPTPAGAPANVKRLQTALATAALPLEVLRGQIAVKPYSELSATIQQEIVEATDAIRAALAVEEDAG